MFTFARFCVFVACLGMAKLVRSQRPVYNIGHMVNSVAEIDDWLKDGANALEADVAFKKTGELDKFYHGPICDYGRNCDDEASIGSYVDALKGNVHCLLPVASGYPSANSHSAPRGHNI